jgi:hypothetical protein
VDFHYSSNLITEIIAYYREVYGTKISPVEAEAFLDSFSLLYDVMQRSAQVTGGVVPPQAAKTPNPKT